MIGIALIAVAAFRFVRTGRLLDDEQSHSASNVRTELILSLVLIMAALAAYVALESRRTPVQKSPLLGSGAWKNWITRSTDGKIYDSFVTVRSRFR